MNDTPYLKNVCSNHFLFIFRKHFEGFFSGILFLKMEKVQGTDALRCKNILVTRVKHVEKDAFIMGFHVHKAAWTPSNGKLLSCVIELSNVMDKYADAVLDKDKKVVGHLPRKN